jgi:DSF synthase
MSKSELRFLAERYSQLDVRYDQADGIAWCFYRPRARPCFNLDLLREIRHFQLGVVSACRGHDETTTPVRYVVWGSRIPGVYNLGGDLGWFLELIRARDREALKHYAVACIDVVYPNSVNLDSPLTTIAMVQGAALGGGFEAAISSSVVVAEKPVQMGLPEIMFNLFPGMGAYSFLSRRMPAIEAERIILSGDMWTAEQLHARAVVDILAEVGGAEDAVRSYVRRQQRIGNGTAGVLRARQRVDPISYGELFDIALIWVDCALRLTDKDLRVMERLVRAQDRLPQVNEPVAAAPPSNVVSISF